MKQKLTLILSLALCALTLVSCANSEEFSDKEKLSAKYTRSKDADTTFNYADGAVEPPNAYNNYANYVTGFELSQFRSLAKTEGESFVFSPVSATLQLSMLANAASADTRREILLALGGDVTLDDLNTCSSYFKSRMESVSKSGLAKGKKAEEFVALDGAMLINDSIDVKSSFLQTAKDFYNYDIFRFAFKGENAQKKLKKYLKPYTNDGKISLDNGSINLISAAEVNDLWLETYAAQAVKGTFTGDTGAREAEFFSSNESKIQSDKAVGIIKYTAKNPLKLVMVMPDTAENFDAYAQSFDNAELAALLESVDITAKTTAVIPSFSVESDKTAVPLSAPLSTSGLYSLFTGKAGFSALSYTESATVGEMYEIRPDFRCDSKGINAEDIELADEARGQLEKTDDTVEFNRPFIFILIDNESNIPVQMGIYK